MRSRRISMRLSGSKESCAILHQIFATRIEPEMTQLRFNLEDVASAAREIDISVPEHFVDVLQYLRFDRDLLSEITAAADGYEWVVQSLSMSVFHFVLRMPCRLQPNPMLVRTRISSIRTICPQDGRSVSRRSLLAKIRQNHLVSTFLNMSCHPLKRQGQSRSQNLAAVQPDDLYIGTTQNGEEVVAPLQILNELDAYPSVQILPNLEFCRDAFPTLSVRPVAAQLFRDGMDSVIALFEFNEVNGVVTILNERHFLLVPVPTWSRNQADRAQHDSRLCCLRRAE